MERPGQARTVKKYKKGNITASFGTDLFIQGSTSIPNLLLKLYKHMGLSDHEMMLIIQLFRLHTEEKKFMPPLHELCAVIDRDEEQLAGDLDSLMQKEMLRVTEYYGHENASVIKGYDFEPLFEKLSEIWACARVKENERIRKIIEKEPATAVNLYHSFEKEFGRPLSPMEVEQINLWSAKTNPHMVLEALRKAVMLGKHNFKYIDSILLGWEKNNLRTPADVEEYDRGFKDRKSNSRQAPHADKSKKMMLQSLYRN
ncbi:MAG: DnaD domain protein [Firmicutes bacterium]|nr:DnaD domain protein [Bacillota bacterium]